MAQKTTDKQQESLWHLVNWLCGGLVNIEIQRCDSPTAFCAREWRTFLKSKRSAFDAALSSSSISPRPFSTASHRFAIKCHFSLVWESSTTISRRNHDGLSPELSCHTFNLKSDPNDFCRDRVKVFTLPLAKNILCSCLHAKIIGFETPSSPYSTRPTLAVVPEFLHAPVCMEME